MDGGFGDYDYEQTQHQNHQYEEYSEYGVESNANVDSQNANPRDSSAGKLFVGGVPWETSEEAFTSYFSEYGEITDSVLMRDKHTGRPRGFGFVTFAESAVADKVLEKDHIIDGKMVEVKRTVPREDMEPRTISKTKKIFVGGIPASLTEDQLKEYFEPYGSIIDHQIMLDHTTGRSRGFGFVTFENEESVEKIFTDGEKHELGGRQVEIKRAEPKRGGSGGGDYSGNGGGGGKFHGGFGSGGGRGRSRGGYEDRYSGRYNGEMSRGYVGFGEDYVGYGAYGGGYGATPAGFYGGYGGYGYGFVPPMYGGSGGYGGYGGAGYPNPSSYMGTDGYGGTSKGFGSGSGKGFGNGGPGTGRYHPYNRK